MTDDTAKRDQQIVELRRAGVPFDVIADRLGMLGAEDAEDAYRQAREKTPKLDHKETRQLEAERLERLLAALWPAAMKGDVGAADRVLRISERRAKLLGLDMER